MNHEDRRPAVFADSQRSFEYHQKTVICSSVLSRVHFGHTAMKCWYGACLSGNFGDFKYFFRKYHNASVFILAVVVLLCSLVRLYVCKKNRWLHVPFAVCCWRRASVISNTFDAESQTVFFVVFCASTAAFSLSTFYLENVK